MSATQPPEAPDRRGPQRFGVYLTLEEMRAAAHHLLAEHGNCSDGCAARSAGKRLALAAHCVQEKPA